MDCGVKEPNQLCMAMRQLLTALSLYFDGNDCYSVITLAGVADEILGKRLNELGKEHHLESFAAAVVLPTESSSEPLKEKEVIASENCPRNVLKHRRTGRIEFDAAQKSWEMLDRALINLNQLHGCSEKVPEFWECPTLLNDLVSAGSQFNEIGKADITQD